MRHALGALGIVFLSLASAWAAAPSAPAEKARAILQGEPYQTDLPFTGKEPAATGTVRRGRWGREADAPGFSLPIPGLPTLALVGLVILLAVGLALVVSRLASRSGARERAAPEPAAPAVLDRQAPIEDAEVLAQAGRFGDAIHALLLAALRELARREGSPAASPAVTSREVLRSATLGSELKAALAPLVTAVESIHFGRATAGLVEYAGCAASYRQLRKACRLPA